MAKKNKIMIPIDLDAFITSRDRQDALYKAVEEAIRGRDFISKLREQLIDRLIADATVTRLQTAFDSAFLEIYTKDKIREVIRSKSYGIATAIEKQIEGHTGIIEKDVIELMKGEDFAEQMANIIKAKIVDKLTKKLSTYYDEGD